MSARAYGLDEHVGSLEPGKLADLVMWPRTTFGVRPSLVLKAGVPVWAAMGDAAASCVEAEPVLGRPSWGYGSASAPLGLLFVSRLAVEHGYVTSLGSARSVVTIRDVRRLGKRDMVRNDALPDLTVDPRTFEVRADGVLLACEPTTRVPLGPRYLLR